MGRVGKESLYRPTRRTLCEIWVVGQARGASRSGPPPDPAGATRSGAPRRRRHTAHRAVAPYKHAL
jgi:hypothetical protein